MLSTLAERRYKDRILTFTITSYIMNGEYLTTTFTPPTSHFALLPLNSDNLAIKSAEMDTFKFEIRLPDTQKNTRPVL